MVDDAHKDGAAKLIHSVSDRVPGAARALQPGAIPETPAERYAVCAPSAYNFFSL